MHVPHQLTRLDTQHCALNIIYNSFGFYLFVPYLTSLRTTLTWAFDHQRQNFPSCRIVRKYILKYDAKQNYRIRFQYIIALLWSAEMLLNYFQGNTGATGTRILVYFTGILMWAQPVCFFLGGVGGGLAAFSSTLFDWMVLIRRYGLNYLFSLHKCRSCLWPLKLMLSQARTSGTTLTRDFVHTGGLDFDGLKTYNTLAFKALFLGTTLLDLFWVLI